MVGRMCVSIVTDIYIYTFLIIPCSIRPQYLRRLSIVINHNKELDNERKNPVRWRKKPKNKIKKGPTNKITNYACTYLRSAHSCPEASSRLLRTPLIRWVLSIRLKS